MPEPGTRHVPIRDGSLRLHVRQWPGNLRPFVLVHGLSSNKLTWDAVATRLAAAGHAVTTVDQRGHGLSDKPDAGYDFATISGDLLALLDALHLERPVLAGQSWGGNVVLDFAARNPGRAWGLALVDGGVFDLQEHDGGDWETISAALRPPDLAGTPRSEVARMIAGYNPEWNDAAIDATLGNMETLPDGTVRPWLTLERHMRILRALWEQRPGELYPLVVDPVLICVADDGSGSPWSAAKQRMALAAQSALQHASVRWFPDTAHDIHVHRPDQLATLFLDELAHGIWSRSRNKESAT